MKSLVNAGLGAFILYFVLVIAFIFGWIMNIIDIIHTLHGPINAMFIARIAGVFVAPLGAILGYF